jgi:hypothetical protein
MVAAVAFVIGIGIGLTWGPFASRRGGPIETPVAHRAGDDAGHSAMASSEPMTPIPPDASDAPDAINAGSDAIPPEQQRKRNLRTAPNEPFDPSGSRD